MDFRRVSPAGVEKRTPRLRLQTQNAKENPHKFNTMWSFKGDLQHRRHALLAADPVS